MCFASNLILCSIRFYHLTPCLIGRADNLAVLGCHICSLCKELMQTLVHLCHRRGVCARLLETCFCDMENLSRLRELDDALLSACAVLCLGVSLVCLLLLVLCVFIGLEYGLRTVTEHTPLDAFGLATFILGAELLDVLIALVNMPAQTVEQPALALFHLDEIFERIRIEQHPLERMSDRLLKRSVIRYIITLGARSRKLLKTHALHVVYFGEAFRELTEHIGRYIPNVMHELVRHGKRHNTVPVYARIYIEMYRAVARVVPSVFKHLMRINIAVHGLTVLLDRLGGMQDDFKTGVELCHELADCALLVEMGALGPCHFLGSLFRAARQLELALYASAVRIGLCCLFCLLDSLLIAVSRSGLAEPIGKIVLPGIHAP